MITAVVLAAGLSRRMGSFKPLLPLGDRTVLARVVDLYKHTGVEDILVVVGKEAGEMRPAVDALGARQVHNPAYTTGMFSSVEAGVRALPPQAEGFFVHPVDIPLVRPETIRRLITAFGNASATVVYPQFDGQRGHPPLIQAGLAPRILEWRGTGGLRQFLETVDLESLDLAVADEAILWDLDTPTDYQRMQDRLARAYLPTDRECRVLMHGLQHLPPPVAVHCRYVAKVANRMAQALNRAGHTVDMELTRTAALLHDIARTQKNHARMGAQQLASHGFQRVAAIVAAHMDLTVRAEAPLDETQIVYLADKLAKGDRPVSIEERFAAKIEKYARTPEILDAIKCRKETACRIRDKVEGITQRLLEDIVRDVENTPDEEA